MRASLSPTAGLVLAVAAAGCAGDVGTDEMMGSAFCNEGQVRTCVCPDGTASEQQCLAGGRASECACGAPGNVPGNLPGDPTSMTVDPATPGQPEPGQVAEPEQEPPAMEPVEPVEPSPMEPVMDPVMDPPDPIVAVGVPATPHCESVADWDPAWVEWEDEVLRLTNEKRAAGANCGTEGSFPAAEPLTTNAELRCAARLHSLDMAQNNYFDHYSQDGTDPFQRMQAAGYVGGAMGENIAAGQRSPQEVVDGWMDSDGHCANIMQQGFTELGVGYYGVVSNTGRPWEDTHMWTQNFGAPAGGGGGGGGNGNWPWGP